jgi:plasmid stabilization system protein ParE
LPVAYAQRPPAPDVYKVSLTKDAERDLEEIYVYIAEHDSRASADHVLDRLVKATEALKTSPDRAAYVNELRSLDISEYRQVLFEPLPFNLQGALETSDHLSYHRRSPRHGVSADTQTIGRLTTRR